MNADSKTKGVPEELLNDTNFRFSEHYKFRSLLGQGGFGVVVLATSKATCENMAVKVTPPRATHQIIEKDKISTVEVDKIKGEAEMLNSLDNQHIVKFKEVHPLRLNISCTRARTSCTLPWNISAAARCGT